MPQEAILVKELKTEEDKNKRPFQVVIDGYNQVWRLFNPPISRKLELNKAYLFKYELSSDGQFKNVKVIEDLANTFQQKALRELANKSEIVRNYSVATSYAVNMACNGIIEPDKIFEWANKIYTETQNKADEEMSKIEGIEK
jgi:hypothetical protein